MAFPVRPMYSGLFQREKPAPARRRAERMEQAPDPQPLFAASPVPDGPSIRPSLLEPQGAVMQARRRRANSAPELRRRPPLDEMVADAPQHGGGQAEPPQDPVAFPPAVEQAVHHPNAVPADLELGDVVDGHQAGGGADHLGAEPPAADGPPPPDHIVDIPPAGGGGAAPPPAAAAQERPGWGRWFRNFLGNDTPAPNTGVLGAAQLAVTAAIRAGRQVPGAVMGGLNAAVGGVDTVLGLLGLAEHPQRAPANADAATRRQHRDARIDSAQNNVLSLVDAVGRGAAAYNAFAEDGGHTDTARTGSVLGSFVGTGVAGASLVRGASTGLALWRLRAVQSDAEDPAPDHLVQARDFSASQLRRRLANNAVGVVGGTLAAVAGGIGTHDPSDQDANTLSLTAGSAAVALSLARLGMHAADRNRDDTLDAHARAIHDAVRHRGPHDGPAPAGAHYAHRLIASLGLSADEAQGEAGLANIRNAMSAV